MTIHNNIGNDIDDILKTREKLCPHCGSKEVVSTGDRFAVGAGEKMIKPNNFFYQCQSQSCKKIFLYIEEKT